MYERMRSAILGDDGLDGDPTARELEALVADKLGKEAGLFVPTATMGNLLAAMSQTQRQAKVLIEANAHMLVSEWGGAILSGLSYVGVPGSQGAINLDSLRQALSPTGPFQVELICMETTHANAGGTVLPLDHMRAVREAADTAGVRVHVDGARLFNAAVALNLSPDALTCFADTVVICLSKGLSAPAGAVLVGPLPTIDKARHLRKILGGTQRQVGIVAAAGLVAIETMTDRLVEDHLLAKRLSAALNTIHDAALQANTPQTNIVFADLGESGPDSSVWASQLKRLGVLVRPWGERRLRLVTHRHLDDASIDGAVAAFRKVAEVLLEG